LKWIKQARSYWIYKAWFEFFCVTNIYCSLRSLTLKLLTAKFSTLVFSFYKNIDFSKKENLHVRAIVDNQLRRLANLRKRIHFLWLFTFLLKHWFSIRDKLERCCCFGFPGRHFYLKRNYWLVRYLSFLVLKKLFCRCVLTNLDLNAFNPTHVRDYPLSSFRLTFAHNLVALRHFRKWVRIKDPFLISLLSTCFKNLCRLL
jgi:hypothetical protein